MNAQVIIQFRMEGCGELPTLLRRNDMSVDGGDSLTVVTRNRLDIRCTDEGHRHLVAYTSDRARGVEAIPLPSVGIAAHLDMHRT